MLAILPWVLVVLIGWVVAEASNSWLLGFLVYGLAALVAMATLVLRRPAKLLSANRQMSPSVVGINQPVQIAVSLSWESWPGPGWVLAQDTLPDVCRALNPCGQLFVAGSTSQAAFAYRITVQRRGYFPIGPVSVTSGDLFGLGQSKALGEECHFLTVHPKIIAVPPLRIASNRPIGDARSQKRMYEDPTLLAGVRDYAPGDTLNKIHWKTTARTGTLATKQCEPSTSVEVNLLVNFFNGDYPPRELEPELACTVAASVAARLVMDKNMVGMISNGWDTAWHYGGRRKSEWLQVKPDKGQRHLTTLLSMLARLELSDGPELAQFLLKVQAQLPWTANTLIITHYLDENAALVLESLKRGGLELAAIIVSEGPYAEQSHDRVAALGIPVTMVRRENELANLEFWRPGRQ